MFELNKYIGKRFCLRQISYSDGVGDSLPLFCIIDVLEEEMQDYVSSRDERHDGFDEQRNKFLIYETKTGLLTEDILSQIGLEERAALVPLHLERNVDEIRKLLPQRQTVAYARVLQNDSTNRAKEIVENNSDVDGCMRELTKKYLGYDSDCIKKYIGKTILVCYNPIYKSINLKEDGKNPGLYFRVNYWNGHREQLSVVITGKDKDGTELFKQNFKTEKDAFLTHFDFEKSFNRLDIDVKTLDGTLVDYYKDVVFIHSISVRVNANG